MSYILQKLLNNKNHTNEVITCSIRMQIVLAITTAAGCTSNPVSISYKKVHISMSNICYKAIAI